MAERSGDIAFGCGPSSPKRRGASLPAAVQNRQTPARRIENAFLNPCLFVFHPWFNLSVVDFMERILIIEDETPMRTALADLLAGEGYRALSAADGESGLQRALVEKPDLILLDIMLPKLDGFSVCAELRRLGVEIPVLMLTAKGQIEDRVTGLDAGADDYLVKPFSTEELLARVRALLRRAERKNKSPMKLKLGETEIDLARQTAMRGKKGIHLTAKEFAMLRLLAEAEGEPVTREKFLDVVWGYTAFPTTRTVDNHIASLRAKLEKNPVDPRWLKTVHGVGYKLDL